MKQKDQFYDDFKLIKNLRSRWSIQKYFSVVTFIVWPMSELLARHSANVGVVSQYITRT